MKIISWNVNGIRAWQKKGKIEWFLKQSPDFFCVQETKAHPEQLDDKLINPKGYLSFFNWSTARKGYSGVAIYSKQKPNKIKKGLGNKKMDEEGRQITLFYDDFVLINCYFPNGGSSPEKFDFKIKYYNLFLKFLDKLKRDGHKNIIFCGDFNVAHHEIDLARPKENKNSVGFLPIEREWVDSLEKKDYVDTFRVLNPKKIQYSWWDFKTRSRERNVGWRIDYFFISKILSKNLKSSKILDSIEGSDHAPIKLELNL